MILDPKTALIFMLSVSVVNGFTALLLWKSHKHLRGLGSIALGNLLLCLAFALVIDRSVHVITIHNVLIILSQATLAEGVTVFMGHRPARRLILGLAVFTAIAWEIMQALAPDGVPLRIAVITLLTLGVFGRCVFLMLRSRPNLGLAGGVILGCLILHMGVLSGRMLLSLAHPDPAFALSPPIQGWFFLETTLVITLVFFSILLMVGTRLANDLHQQTVALATERRLKSELRQFLHMLGHELRTPLAIISRATEAASALLDLTPSEVGRNLATVRTTTQRVERLVDNLLTAERAGMEPAKPEILQLEAIAAETVALLTEKFGRDRLHLVPAPAPADVIGDRELLFTAIINLLDNALKYSSPPAPVRAEMSVADREVRLLVKDRGIGFPPEQLTLVGQRFFRADNAKAQPGTGLGLYMVKTIAQRHGGRLEVANSAEGGAEVTLILPQA